MLSPRAEDLATLTFRVQSGALTTNATTGNTEPEYTTLTAQAWIVYQARNPNVQPLPGVDQSQEFVKGTLRGSSTEFVAAIRKQTNPTCTVEWLGRSGRLQNIRIKQPMIIRSMPMQFEAVFVPG